MKQNNNVDPINECFMQMDLHKAQVQNHVRQDIMVVFAGLKEFL